MTYLSFEAGISIRLKRQWDTRRTKNIDMQGVSRGYTMKRVGAKMRHTTIDHHDQLTDDDYDHTSSLLSLLFLHLSKYPPIGSLRIEFFEILCISLR